MDWISSNWRIIILAIVVIIVGYAILQYVECRKAGKGLSSAFKCQMFRSKPVSILPIDEYYDLSGGECYHYIDYGDRMSIKKVEMEKCS